MSRESYPSNFSNIPIDPKLEKQMLYDGTQTSIQTRDLLEIIAKQKENNPNPVLTQENWSDIIKIHDIDAVYKYEEFVQNMFYLQCLYAIVNDYFVQTKEHLPSKKFNPSEFDGIAVSLGVPESMVKNYASENNIQLHDQLPKKRTYKKTVTDYVDETKLPGHINDVLHRSANNVAYLKHKNEQSKDQIKNIEEEFLNFILRNNDLSEEQKELALENYIAETQRPREDTDMPPEYYYSESKKISLDDIFGDTISRQQSDTTIKIPITNLTVGPNIEFITDNKQHDGFLRLKRGKDRKIYYTDKHGFKFQVINKQEN